MRRKDFRNGLFSAAMLLGTLSQAAVIEGYVGYSATEIAPFLEVKLIDINTGNVVATERTGFMGGYEFEEIAPGYYQVAVGDFENGKRNVELVSGSDEVRLDIDLSAKGGVMDYSKAGKTAPKPKSSSGSASGSRQQAPAQQSSQPNNQELANAIAGVWWGYAGSTERKVGLCPGGGYMDYTESGYSGSSYNMYGDQTMAWGAASQGGGQGRWTIQGDYQNGVIHVQYNNGSTTTLRYNQIGDPGCLNINGAKLCRQSATCQ